MNKKIKVLFFIESLSGGGAEKVLATLVQHIDKNKFDITVSTVTDGGVYSEKISQVVNYIPLIKTKKQILYKILYKAIYNYLPLIWVYKLFIPKGNDIEIAFCEGYATKLLAISPTKNKLTWVHTDLISNPWTQNSVYLSVEQEKKSYSKYTNILGVSDSVSKSFEKKFNLHATTIYNPIDSDDIINKSKYKIDLPSKTRTRIVTIGRLVDQKGYDRLLVVAKNLIDEGLDFELWILGDGPQRSILAHYIEENKLFKNIKLWGFVGNPYPYIAASDLFVCSSRSEGYSTVVTEALILETPVITTLCAGMKELLGEYNEWGVVVENNDSALIDPIRKVINNRSYLIELKNKATERGSKFKIESLIKPIEHILETCN